MAKKKTEGKTQELSDTHFLVVDDDAVVRQNVVDYLNSFGFERITQASNGVEALQILKTHAIDFIISDWDMPGATGLDVLNALKKSADLKHIPFIMVTSPISQEKFKVIEAATSKVDAYIIKPFRSQVLKSKIETLLSARSFVDRGAVLVVDDDPMIIELVTEYLKQMGYSKIYTADNGATAFELVKKHLSELAFVVSDWEMPGMAGIELLKSIRDSDDDELANLPFIMATSQTSIERIKLKRAIEADVDHYLLKPFKMTDLKEKVDQALARARVERELEHQLNLAEQYVGANLFDDAERVYAEMIKKNGRYVKAYLGLAATLIRNGRREKEFDRATQHVRAALSINPKYDQSYVQLSAIFESAMSIDKAIATLKEGLDNCPFSEEIHFHLGRLLIRRGLKDEGMENLRRALEIRPDYTEAQELLNANQTGN